VVNVLLRRDLESRGPILRPAFSIVTLATGGLDPSWLAAWASQDRAPAFVDNTIVIFSALMAAGVPPFGPARFCA